MILSAALNGALQTGQGQSVNLYRSVILDSGLEVVDELDSLVITDEEDVIVFSDFKGDT